MAMGVTGQNMSHLSFIIDEMTRLHFLVDTGMEVSLMLSSQAEQSHARDGFSLQVANKTLTTTFGQRSLI